MQHCSTSNNNLSLSTLCNLAASIRDDKAGKSSEERVFSHASALLHFQGLRLNVHTQFSG